MSAFIPIKVGDLPDVIFPLGTSDFVPVSQAGVMKKMLASAAGGGGGGNEVSYNPVPMLTVWGSPGITAAFASGTLTISIPANAVLRSGLIDLAVADATYNNGVVSQGFRILVNNFANNKIFAIQPVLLARTAAGAVTPSNPLSYNTAVNLAASVDKFDTAEFGYVFPSVAANAPAGAVIMF
jgi:hypothetical protein